MSMGMGIGDRGRRNRAEAERMVDDLRANPGTARRRDRSEQLRFAFALVPLVAIVVVGLIFL